MHNEVLVILFTVLSAYLLGSLNFAVIISRLKGNDVRTMGSGNAGSTNMFRNFGVKLALLTFLGDFSKGILAVIIAEHFFRGSQLFEIARGAAAIFVLIGHMKPMFFGFKGGKGVATALGTLLILAPIPFSIVFVLGIAIIAITGFVSMAAVSMASFYPVMVYFYMRFTNTFSSQFMVVSIIIASLVLISHRGNIKRLISGTENSIYKNRR